MYRNFQAQIQTTIIDRPWQVVNHDGTIAGHFTNRRTAEATSDQYPDTSVRYAGH